jgi:hypothetical protein
MFFLLRIAFWLGVVCVLLPGSSKTPDANIDATQALTLANAAVSDMRGFCDRQPEACVTGGKVATAIGQKAEAGARTIYDFVSTKMTEKSEPADRVVSSDKPTGKVVPVTARGTLTSADIAPAWHAPVPLPPRRTRPSA